MPQDFWGRVVYLLQTRGSSYAMGALNTMIIALVSTFIGCVIGFAVGIVQTIPVSKKDSVWKKGILGIIKFILGV